MANEDTTTTSTVSKWIGIALIVLLPIAFIAFLVLTPDTEDNGPNGPGNAQRPNATAPAEEPTDPDEATTPVEPEETEAPEEPAPERPTEGDSWYDYDGEELNLEATAALEDTLSEGVLHYYAVSSTETQEERTERLRPYFKSDSPLLVTNPLSDGSLAPEDTDPGSRVDLITHVDLVETLQATDTLYSGWMELRMEIVITGETAEDNYIIQGTQVVGVLAAKNDKGVWYIEEIREQSS